MIRGLQEVGMSPEQKYESQKSALFDQYRAAMRESGQEQIKKLEEYKQAAASFGQAWSAGVTKTTSSMLFGDQTSIIVKGQDIIQSVVSDIEVATQAQQRALDSLAEEKQKEIEANKKWGDVLVQTAQDWAAEIDKLKGVIGKLEAKIAAMQKTITIEGVDHVSGVVDTIARSLADLHDKTVYITTIQRTIREGYSPTGESVVAPLTLSDFTGGGESGYMAPFDYKTGFALGTGYVPKTGMYLLHRGEAVDTPRQAAAARSLNMGDIIINIPESAAPQRPEDWRAITRQYIVPELEKIGHA